MRKTLLVLVLCLLSAVPAAAGDWDDLFGEDLLMDVVDEDVDHSLALLRSEAVDWSGRLQASSTYVQELAEEFGSGEYRTRLSGRLQVQVRPDTESRLLVQTEFSAPLAAGEAVPMDITLSEAFADWHWDNRLHFRLGKQAVKWGVGYFFSPADVISIGRLDPTDPEAAREGPTALRLYVPQRRADYYLFALLDDSLSDMALAPRASFVVGRSEIGIGAFYQADKAPRGMVTLSTSLGEANVFAEGVISRGSDKRFLEETAGGLTVVERDDWFVHGTAGFSLNRSDELRRFQLFLAAQYFFNSEGYHDTALFEHPGLPLLVLTNQIGISDLMQPGRHYGAVTLGWSDILRSSFSASTLWLGNFSDGSGTVTTSLSYGGWGELRPSLDLTYFYGPEPSEFQRGETMVSARLSYRYRF